MHQSIIAIERTMDRLRFVPLLLTVSIVFLIVGVADRHIPFAATGALGTVLAAISRLFIHWSQMQRRKTE